MWVKNLLKSLHAMPSCILYIWDWSKWNFELILFTVQATCWFVVFITNAMRFTGNWISWRGRVVYFLKSRSSVWRPTPIATILLLWALPCRLFSNNWPFSYGWNCLHLRDDLCSTSCFLESLLGRYPCSDFILFCENQGRFDRALAIMKDMDGAGVKPDVNTYRLLIFACSLRRDQDRADQVTNQELLHWGLSKASSHTFAERTLC